MADSLVVGTLQAILTLDSAEFESGIRKVSPSLQSLSKDLGSIGRQAVDIGKDFTVAFTVPIVGALGASAKAAIDFESSFAGVKKTVEATEPEFAAMAAQLRELATTIPVSVDELNRLAEAAGALGIPKEEIVDFARVMAELGVTTNLTADQAAESIAKIQNIFGAAGQETENFASTLVALGNAGASTETQILEMATRIAGAGATFGLSQAQVLGFANALASLGLEAEGGGSAISRTFRDIARAVSEGGAELEKFATVANRSTTEFATLFKEDAAQAMVLFIEGLGRIRDTGGDLIGTLDSLGITEARQVDTLQRVAGAAKMVGESLSAAGDEWRKNTALTEEAAERFKTTESQLTLLWNRIKDVAITFGNALLPMIQAAIGVLNSLIPVLEGVSNIFASLPLPIQASVVGLGLLVAAIGPALIIFGQMALGAQALTLAFTTTGVATRALALIIPALNAAFPTFIALASAATAQFGLFSGASAALAGTLQGVAYFALGVGAAFAGWKIGEWIGETSGLTDGLGKVYAKLGELVHLLPEGTAAQYDATQAAMRLHEATEKQTGGFDAAAAAAKRLRDQISGTGLAKDVQELSKILNEQLSLGPLDPGVFQRVAEAAENLKKQGIALTPELQKIVEQYEAMHRTGTDAAGATNLLTDAQKQYNAAVKAIVDELSGRNAVELAHQWSDALTALSKQGIQLSTEDWGKFTEIVAAAVDAMQRAGREIPAAWQTIANTVHTDQMLQDMRDLIGENSKYIEINRQLPLILSEVAVSGEAAMKALPFIGERIDLTPLFEYTDGTEALADLWSQLLKLELGKIHEQAAQLRDLGDAFQFLGSTLDGSAGQLVSGIGRVIQAFADWDQASKTAAATGKEIQASFAGVAAGIVDGVSAIIQATEGGGNAALNTMSGAMAGLSAGLNPQLMAVTQGWSAAIGLAAGAMVGLTRSMQDGTAAIEDYKQAVALAREFTADLSDAFLDGADAADLIRVGVDNTSRSIAAIDQVYEDLGILGSGESVIDALNRAVREGPEAVQRILDNINALMDKHAQIMQNWAEGVATFTAGLTERIDGFARSMEGVTEVTEETQASFTLLTEYVTNAFAIILTQSGSAIQALSAIQGPLDQLIELQQRLGLEGTETFQHLADVSAVIKANQDIFDSIAGLQQMMQGLAQATILTSEDMQRFGRDAAALFGELITRGVDANTAMALMQPTLQALWEHQQKFGDITDEATLALLAQAEAAGMVGEEQKSINAQILDAVLGVKAGIEGVEAAIRRLPAAFAEATTAAQALNNEFSRFPDSIPSPGTPTGGVAVPKFHTGGVITAHRGLFVGDLLSDERLVKMQTGEGVLSRFATSMLGGARTVNALNTDPWGAVQRLASQTMATPSLGTASAPLSSGGMTIGDIHITVNAPGGDPALVAQASKSGLMAALDELEQGGPAASRYRRVHQQIVVS